HFGPQTIRGMAQGRFASGGAASPFGDAMSPSVLPPVVPSSHAPSKAVAMSSPKASAVEPLMSASVLHPNADTRSGERTPNTARQREDKLDSMVIFECALPLLHREVAIDGEARPVDLRGAAVERAASRSRG